MRMLHHFSAKVIAIILVAISFTLPAKAQINPQTYFNIDWQLNAPINTDFADKASVWGMNFEGGYYVLPDLAIGAFINFHSNHEYVGRRTLPVGTSASLNTDQQHSLFQLPFGIVSRYRFANGSLQPYIGFKLGADYTRMSSDFYVYEITQTTWGLYLSPEVGISFYPWNNGIGFHAAAYYNCATNKGTLLNYHLSRPDNYGLRFGVAF